MEEIMTSKQRLLITLKHGIPDRVPIAPHFGREYVGHYIKKTDEPIEAHNEWIDAYLSAYKEFGFDAMLQIYCGNKCNSIKNWEIHKELKYENLEYRHYKTTITTPEGNLTQDFKITKHPQSHWAIDYLIKNPEDISLIKYLPDPIKYMDITPFKYAQEKVGNDGIAYGLVLGVWHAGCNLRGGDQLMLDLFDRPSWVNEFFRYLTDYTIKQIEVYAQSNAQLLEIGESFVGMGLSPSIYKEFILPFDREIVHACLNNNIMAMYHNCGHCKDLLELMADTGATALETITPISMGGNVSLKEAKRKVGDRLCLRGSIDQHILAKGSSSEIESHVTDYIQDAGADGGFIIGTGEFSIDVPMTNLAILAKAVNKYGYY